MRVKRFDEFINEGKSHNIKVGDILYKGDMEGEVTKVMDDMVNVKFGDDEYGIMINRIEGDQIKESNEDQLNEGVKDVILSGLVILGGVLGFNHLNHSVQRGLDSGEKVEISTRSTLFNNRPLSRTRFQLKVDLNQSEPVKVDTAKNIITINTTDVSNVRLKKDVRNEIKKIDPTMVSQDVRTIHFDVITESKSVEDQIPGGMADDLSAEDIAKKHKVSVGQIEDQIEKGKKVEMEHTDDPDKAEEIAKDHLMEMPDYYDKLEKIEPQHESLNEGAKPWGKRDEAKAIKNFSAARIKHIKNLKSMNYHLFPTFIKSKIDGMDAIISGVYEVSGKLKMEYDVIEKSKPVGYNKVITQNKFDRLISKANDVVGPKELNVSMIKAQTNKYQEWLDEQAEKAAASAAKAKAKGEAAAESMEDLRAVSGVLKSSLKSVKGYYATWNKNKEMGISLPYKFKPTIAKFEQEGETDLYINFETKTLYKNRYSPKYDSIVGDGSEEVGSFKDMKSLIALIKKTHTATKKQHQEEFNNSPANDWKY